MGEFELIRRYFLPVADLPVSASGRHPAVLLGPGDDCAIQRLAPGQDLVFSVDTLVESVHFPQGYSAEKLGWRSLAVATSDLAAMGADPVCFTLAIALPEANEEWLQGFAGGLSAAARQFGLSLAGGDTTRGPLTLTLQVHGTVPCDQAILRSTAKPGDLVCVSGTLGNAGAALYYLDVAEPTADEAEILAYYHAPEPKLALGRALRGVASAAVDISDGLVADLTHILESSGVGAEIDASTLPLTQALRRLRSDATVLALYAGDDYQLCVTLPPFALAGLPESVRAQLTVIGRITDGRKLTLQGGGDNAGAIRGGYDHFGS